jgi:hypothetical protein
MSLEPWSCFDAGQANILVTLQRLFTTFKAIPIMKALPH